VASIRNISSDERYFTLGFRQVTVGPDEVVEVPDDQVESFLCQTSIWADNSAPSRAVKADSPPAPVAPASAPASDPAAKPEENS
jgi:hypothetical protein